MSLAIENSNFVVSLRKSSPLQSGKSIYSKTPRWCPKSRMSYAIEVFRPAVMPQLRNFIILGCSSN